MMVPHRKASRFFFCALEAMVIPPSSTNCCTVACFSSYQDGGSLSPYGSVCFSRTVHIPDMFVHHVLDMTFGGFPPYTGYETCSAPMCLCCYPISYCTAHILYEKDRQVDPYLRYTLLQCSTVFDIDKLLEVVFIHHLNRSQPSSPGVISRIVE